MPHTLTFLHTSPVHIATFNTLLNELAPDIPVHHLVSEQLLQDACTYGLTQDVRDQTLKHLQIAVDQYSASLVVCTCSTIGGVAESLAPEAGIPVLRIDRPMAEEAVERGSKIIVAAALQTTLQPTRELLLSVAQQRHKNVEISDLLCSTAWSYFEAGDQQAYLQEIAQQLQQAANAGDVIVLAQASMARAIELCPGLPVPVLTSPRSGALAAISAFKASLLQ